MTKPWIEKLARFGYTAKGVLYVTAGFLTAAAGLHRGGTTADRRDAIQFIAHQPFGRAMLLVIAAGLVGYAVWRVVSAITDAENHGRDTKGMIIRAASIVRGLFYGALSYTIIRMLLHQGGSGEGSDATSRHWTARALDHPYGYAAVIVAGLSIIIYGAVQCYRAFGAKLAKQLNLARVSAKNRAAILAISRFGVVARGIVFGVIGYSLIRAALHRHSAEAKGVSGALRQLWALPMGSWILTAAGLGFAAYGAYALINARYRRIGSR
ncbi:MAG: hypothetical protein QOK37_462 [Thermoanaerobaculia bacterium]|jgi:hypothetical protein|nr:hypothetical protein [Thermoanaerobaculia bacterium]